MEEIRYETLLDQSTDPYVENIAIEQNVEKREPDIQNFFRYRYRYAYREGGYTIERSR